MLRGEPPPRPNPRQRPHQESFWLHIKPVTYHQAVTRFAYTFRLGLLSVYFFVIELVTGLLLMTWYTPTPAHAYADMGRILARAPMGELLHTLHYLAAIGMIIIVVLHLIRTFFTASYKPPRRFTWLTGVALLLLTLALAFTGYLLPWDQLAFWAVTIGVSLIRAVPGGEWLYRLTVGGAEVGAPTLLRFYILHVLILPLAAIILLSVHYYKVVRHGISLPPSLEPEAGSNAARSIPADQRRPYLLDVALDEALFLSWITAILLLLAIFFTHPPLQAPADATHTPLEIAAPWYFLWLQGLLKLGDVTLFGVILPGAFILLLFLLPYLDHNPHRLAARRPVALGAGILAIIVLIGLSFLGLPRFHTQAPPARLLVQHYAPEEGVGPLQQIPWEALPEGDFCTDNAVQPEPDAPFGRMMADFTQQLTQTPSLENARGCILIKEVQPGIKRVRFYIRYEDASGQPAALLQDFYRHQDVQAASVFSLP